jgi:hypothetical protein
VVQLYTAQSARSKSWSCRYQRAQVKKMHPPTWHGKSSANFCSGAEIYSRKGKRGMGVIWLYCSGCIGDMRFSCMRARWEHIIASHSRSLCFDDIPGNVYHTHMLPWKTSPLRCESYQLLCCWRARVMRNILAFWIIVKRLQRY